MPHDDELWLLTPAERLELPTFDAESQTGTTRVIKAVWAGVDALRERGRQIILEHAKEEAEKEAIASGFFTPKAGKEAIVFAPKALKDTGGRIRF